MKQADILDALRKQGRTDEDCKARARNERDRKDLGIVPDRRDATVLALREVAA